MLRVDGGASANGFLVQFLADVLDVPVEVAAERETTALGAAALAGVAIGRWTQADVASLPAHGGALRAAARRHRSSSPAGATRYGERCV